jgi:hypothetical protein
MIHVQAVNRRHRSFTCLRGGLHTHRQLHEPIDLYLLLKHDILESVEHTPDGIQATTRLDPLVR